MGCECKIEIYSDYGPSFHRESTPVARTAHRCGECHRTITPGERYESISGLWDGYFETHKTCQDCVSLRDAMFCSGWIFGTILEDVQEMVKEGVTVPESCISAMTPKARGMVCEMIEEYWEAYD